MHVACIDNKDSDDTLDAVINCYGQLLFSLCICAYVVVFMLSSIFAVIASGGPFGYFFSRLSFISLIFKTARCRQEYCLKRPFNSNRDSSNSTDLSR